MPCVIALSLLYRHIRFHALEKCAVQLQKYVLDAQVSTYFVLSKMLPKVKRDSRPKTNSINIF